MASHIFGRKLVVNCRQLDPSSKERLRGGGLLQAGTHTLKVSHRRHMERCWIVINCYDTRVRSPAAALFKFRIND